ncbi:hypothetical protein [Streptomyces sp. NPDC058295]|uniref:hypothetical protein n=1 Tax=Streptomyces sp. NPDC058295 TaxID=3346431 RepID=UPI0036E265A0
MLSTTRSLERAEELRAAGVDHPLADQVRELMPGGVDAALELVGCSVLADTFRTVRRHGTVCFKAPARSNSTSSSCPTSTSSAPTAKAPATLLRPTPSAACRAKARRSTGCPCRNCWRAPSPRPSSTPAT